MPDDILRVYTLFSPPMLCREVVTTERMKGVEMVAVREWTRRARYRRTQSVEEEELHKRAYFRISAMSLTYLSHLELQHIEAAREIVDS